MGADGEAHLIQPVEEQAWARWRNATEFDGIVTSGGAGGGGAGYLAGGGGVRPDMS